MRLEVCCKDRLGITQDVLDVLVDYQIDLRGIEIDEGGKIFLNFPNIEFSDFQHLMPKLRLLDGIDDVKTTAFMPSEREQHQFQILLQTLPDPVFSVDASGRILMVNDVACTTLALSKDALIETNVTDLFKGSHIARWLESAPCKANVDKVRFAGQDYSVDLLPILVPDHEHEYVFAGAVFVLKSESRLEQQLTAFHQQHDLTLSNANHIDAEPSEQELSLLLEQGLEQHMKAYEKQLLAAVYPQYPSSRLLARQLGLSHTAVANKLREYGINKKQS